MANKIPAFQFYPSDWRSDNGVQSLNYYERGVWFEILCLMHESDQRGKLLLNGKAMPDEALARLLGLDKQVLLKTLATLLDFGICSRDESGVLFNRRMVKDEAERQNNATRQRKFYQKQNVEKPNGQPNGQPNGNLTVIQQKPNRHSSSSSSKPFSLSNDKEKGGGYARAHGKPPPAAESPPPNETLPEYLLRKQLEYPHFDVRKIHADFVLLCGSEKYPNLKNTRRHFDKWLAEQDVEFESPKIEIEPQNRAEAIKNCNLCDDYGYRKIGDDVMICKHEETATGAKIR